MKKILSIISIISLAICFTHCSNDEDFENNNQENRNILTKSEEITNEDVQLKLAETLINFNNVVKQFYDGSNSYESFSEKFCEGAPKEKLSPAGDSFLRLSYYCLSHNFSDEYILENFRGGSQIVSLLMFMVNNPDSDLTEFFGLYQSDFSGKCPFWDGFKQLCVTIKDACVSAYNWVVKHWGFVRASIVTVGGIIGFFLGGDEDEDKSLSIFTVETNNLITDLSLYSMNNSSLEINTMRI